MVAQGSPTYALTSGALARELAARGLPLSATTLQRYAREGRLPTRVTPGGHYRFDLDEVMAALSRTRSTHSPVEGGMASLIAQHRREIRRIVTRHRGRSVWVFGSVARGEDHEGSDLDFLVEFEPTSSLFDLMHVTDELTKLLGVPVDVVSAGALRESDRHILDEAVPV